MRTAEDVREYLEGVSYPARPEELIATAQANGAPPSSSKSWACCRAPSSFITLARWWSSWNA